MMEVILLQHVDKLGRRGEVVRVKPGFARNFLLPRGLAAMASVGAKRRVEQETKKFVERDDRVKAEAAALAERLAGLELQIAVKADEDGKLYGSVTAADVHAVIVARGIELDRKQVGLDQHVKMLGTYEVPVKLHPDVPGAVKVNVVRE
jgi:large subunit ribosomal protein L9